MSSKIKVDTIENVAGSGNVSLGSGHNLVVPGNITGSGTLGVTGASTLTGDLTVDTTTLKVDSSNNLVGIGTSSPLSLTGNAAPGLTISSNGPFILLQDANNANKVRYISNNTGELQIGQVNDDGSTNKTLHLNVSTDGHVTKPLQPFVRLRLSSDYNSSGSTINSPGNQITGFTVVENVGSHWNSSNNNFTCPVAGVYQVSVFYIKYPQSGTAHVDLHKNGSFVSEIRWRAHEGGSSYFQVGGTASVTCAANDVLDWHYFGGAGIHSGNGSWEIKLSH